MPPQDVACSLPVGTPVTCLSIFDSIIFQAYLDGSTKAFDLSTQQSFPLTDVEPKAFFPAISLAHDGTTKTSGDPTPSSHSFDQSADEFHGKLPHRHITSKVNAEEISPHSRSVPVQDTLSLEDFTAMESSSFQPILLKKETAGWAALSTWTFEHFCDAELGDIQVEVTHKAGKKIPDTLGAYIRSFRSGGEDGERGYLRGWTYEKDAPQLMEDFQVPGFAKDWFARLPKKEDPMFRWIFCGPSGSRTPLHVDPCMTHAWLAQIRGRKRFVLYSPGDLRHLYDKAGACVDVRYPDRERFPTFDAAAPYEVVLSPGDLLLVPAGWAHLVECVDDSISLTHNFLPKDNFPAVRACLLANRLGKAVQDQEKRAGALQQGTSAAGQTTSAED